ncbi:MAG: RNA-guided pseudouridylation complex pseudouridine synthase subunit Cbf5 [Candidatus Woesearchaeota archaeon]
MGQLPFEKIQRQVLVRQDVPTSKDFGKSPSDHTMKDLLECGIINIDKPSGPTSHQVSAFVQKILEIDKSGHSGTLDPKVTGVLPVALGKGTRVVQSLLTAGKEYVCLMHLHDSFDEAKLKDVIENKFTGKIKQMPPAKSAVKRRNRFRKIYYFDILEIKDQDVLFRVGTQAGTYIRKLCHDIGEAMGCGAHMAELRRTKAGPFQEYEDLCTLQDLADAHHYYKHDGDKSRLEKLIHPIEFGVRHLPKVWVTDTTVDSLCNGASLKVPGIAKVESDIQVGEPVAIMTLKGELVSVAESMMISKDMVSKDRGMACRPQQVFMRPGLYPKIEKKT